MERQELSRAFRRLLQDLGKLDVHPSRQVVVSAGQLVSDDAVEPSFSATLFPVRSGEKIYRVYLGFDAKGYIVLDLSSCDCEAGHARKTCKHLVAALAVADDLGYRLESGS